MWHRVRRCVAKCDVARFTKPPSCSHRCEYIQHQPRPFTKRFTSPPAQAGHRRALARDVAGVNLLDPKYKVAPRWSASGDLTARNKGRTSPEHSMVVSQWSLSEHKAQRSFDSQESRPTAKAGLTASFQSEPSGKPKQAGTQPAPQEAGESPSRNFALKAKQLSPWPVRVEGSIPRIRPSMPKLTDVGEEM